MTLLPIKLWHFRRWDSSFERVKTVRKAFCISTCLACMCFTQHYNALSGLATRMSTNATRMSANAWY